LVGHGYDIVRMHAVEEEADQAGAPGFWTKKPYAFQFKKLFVSVACQFLIVKGAGPCLLM